MKTPLNVFKGIEYVRISQLPDDQRDKIKQTLRSHLIIKILMDGKIVSDCIQYKDYEIWYDEAFPNERALSQPFKSEIRSPETATV
jgi:hypothetical protein